jgi:CRP/FNR family transcriptional regulator, nitrogen fixation regulation protein
MFVRTTTDRTPRPNSLGDLGMTSGSNPIVSLNEFTYKKGVEIYGEKEPAEATNYSRMVAARSARFTWSAIFLGWRTVACIDLPPKRP